MKIVSKFFKAKLFESTIIKFTDKKKAVTIVDDAFSPINGQILNIILDRDMWFDQQAKIVNRTQINLTKNNIVQMDTNNPTMLFFVKSSYDKNGKHISNTTYVRNITPNLAIELIQKLNNYLLECLKNTELVILEKQGNIK